MDSRSADSEYIFYADESGDHSLRSIDPAYPVFSLSLCGFKKTTYCSRIVPRFQALKFRYFGHDAIILHEHDIRKQNGAFRILTDRVVRESFLDDLSDCLTNARFKIFSTVIYKPDLKLDLFPENPYAISLRISLQHVCGFLKRNGQFGKRTYFIFEKRGTKEDGELELEFRRIVSGQNDLSLPLDRFEIVFCDKKANSTGMQIADLTARPIGLSVFRKNQTNRAFELIRGKLHRGRRYSRPNQGIIVP
ncbi:Protein of unknown function [Nitratireductor aquibiodomus]|uniref:DUF3800 domain-containing protein n=1 Tax=Nitratireductor aquibiodomus TaxID=204799 RepID=A0A1H4KNU3_9HYPH|nr:Protein of unknown function [Nitratireductor aquibiodomus]